MKKLFLSMMLTLACLLGASAQTLTVCDGEATNQYVPIYGYYYDTPGTISQVLYPATELTAMNGKLISDVTFYANKDITFSGGTQKVSVAELDDNAMTAIVSTGLTPVFEGTLTINGSQVTATFDEPYQYEGGNLLISIEIVTRGTCSGSGEIFFLGTATDYSSSWYNKGYASPGQQFLPKATFSYGDPKADDARIDKEAINFGAIPVNMLPGNAVVTVTNKGVNAFTPAVTINGNAFTTTYTATEVTPMQSVEIPVKFDAQIGEYTGTMTVDCGAAGVFEVALTGSVVEPVYEVTVADGTTTNQYVPMSVLWWDTQGHASQVIYKKSDLASLAGKKITSVKYYPTKAIELTDFGGEATLSFGTTDDDVFATATALNVSPVAKWVPTADGALEIELESPYEYDGQSNLVVEFQVTTQGDGYQRSGPSFYGISGSYASIYKTSSTFSRQSFTPKTTFGFAEEEQPVEYTITMTPEPGTFDGPQTVLVTVEPEMPEGASIKYTFEAGHREAEEMDYNDSGIEITQSGLLTIIVRDATGAELASTEGEYTINGSTTAIEAISGKAVAGVRYYNVAGVASDKAFDGVNIVVTTYTDGTQHVTKIVK